MHSFDVQNISAQQKVLKQLAVGQKILLSARVIKINAVNKRQERILLVTNQSLYNISPPALLFSLKIKRRISIGKITGITISRFGSQFVVHVMEEADYRAYSPNLKLKIAEHIIMAYSQATAMFVKLYYCDDLTLELYTTTSIDLSKQKRKQMHADYALVNQETFKVTQRSKPDSKLIFRHQNAENVVGFEEFEILKVLGRGAYGKVMLCINMANKKFFAVKSIRKQNLIEKDNIERMKMERSVLEKSSHPFLVSLEYAFQTKEKIFLVMPFIRGGELFTRIRKEKSFSQNRARFYAAQIVLGLEYLHESGYMFRDLKPENILIDVTGYIKISDFGLTKEFKGDEKSYSMAGTPSYISPQVLAHTGHSFQVDWWALGILIFEMLFSGPPFQNPEHKKLFEIIMHKELYFPDGIRKISDSCKDLIRKLLAKNSNDRLGAKGAKEIKSHEWFSSINWTALLNREVEPEYIPKIENNFDVSNFLDYFTKEAPINSIVNTRQSMLEKFEGQFKDFDFLKDEEDLNDSMSIHSQRLEGIYKKK